MARARRAGSTALIVVILAAAAAVSGGAGVLAGPVSWPPSALVVSEVQTGGASASDEFVEVANQGPATVDLLGLEVVYATSSGSTVTRKATWTTSLVLDPGKRLLLANSSGLFGAVADATYSGGFAATGGAIALRMVGGSVIDAVGWGDATNAFVEGTATAAPSPGSSLERAPGGALGNGSDTNENSTDWFNQGTPSPQGLGAPAVPAPGQSPTPTAVPTPDPTASPTATAIPTATPTPVPTAIPAPTATPTPSPSPVPTTAPSPTSTPAPTPTSTPAPTPTPTPVPTPSPTPTPTPVAVTRIADARGLADGATVSIEGVLTTRLGALESGRSGFIQDATGGIALYLDSTVAGDWPAGSSVTATGTVDSRFSQRTLRVAETALSAGPVVSVPDPVDVATGSATESFEGSRIRITGTVTASPDQLADGLGITVDDGSGPVRAVIGPDAIVGLTVGSGSVVVVAGPLGQRDSSGTGSAGYRVQATVAGEVEVIPPATPSPTITPTASPTASPTPAASPTATANPTPTASPTTAPTATPTTAPSPTPSPVASPTPLPSPTTAPSSLASVRTMPIGSKVRTTGVVVAEAGRLGTPALLAIGSADAGIVVHLPDGVPTFARGTLLEVSGKLAAPYGQLEIRPGAPDVHAIGTSVLPAVLPVTSTGLAESFEARLVTAMGRVTAKATKSTSGDTTVTFERDGATPIKVMADASSRIDLGSLKVGGTYRVVGVAGQRATRSGALDGYRIWLRDTADLVVVAAPSASPNPSPAATHQASVVPTLSIARALRIADRDVAIEAVVTGPATLLDTTGRRIVVQDASAAVELLLPTDTTAPVPGTRIRAQGRIGVAYGAPRLRADGLHALGTAASPRPLVLHASPTSAHEWRLVTITGRVAEIHKLGDRWRAEITVGSTRVAVVGQPGAGIPSTTLTEGRTATVVGIARRPYPSASDKRFAVTPRFPADIHVTGRPDKEGDGRGATGSGTAPTSGTGPTVAAAGSEPASDADLVDLDSVVGHIVRVGGLVVELGADGFSLDDGTAVGRVVLRGEALDQLALIEPDDAVNATGRVEAAAGGAVVVVDDPGGIVLAGAPIPAAPSGPPDPSPPGAVGAASSDASSPPPDAAPGAARFAGFGGSLPLGAGAAGLGTLLAVSAASVAVTLVRREHARRRVATHVAGRLATFVGAATGPSGDPADGPPASRSAERGPSTIHSA
ncbi:MAG: lamin tail domain-containing protein [Chloroflexota bacterium]